MTPNRTNRFADIFQFHIIVTRFVRWNSISLRKQQTRTNRATRIRQLKSKSTEARNLRFFIVSLFVLFCLCICAVLSSSRPWTHGLGDGRRSTMDAWCSGFLLLLLLLLLTNDNSSANGMVILRSQTQWIAIIYSTESKASIEATKSNHW